jgi:hypothetical protein
MENIRLHPEFVEMMFYDSVDGVISVKNVKSNIIKFLFAYVRAEDNIYTADMRNLIANNVANALASMNFEALHDDIGRLVDDEEEKNRLVDRQIMMVNEVVIAQFSTSKKELEGFILGKMLKS